MKAFLRLMAFVAFATTLCSARAQVKVFNVLQFGAAGNGQTLDTAAIQRAIDAAAQAGSNVQVLLPRDHHYLVGTLELRRNLEFRLDGTLVISTNPADYQGDGVLTALNAENLRITGSGTIAGRSLDFMIRYESNNEWWLFKEWRPKLFVLTGCTNLEVRDLTFGDAPFWGLHLLGCRNVLVDHVTVRNRLNVPNCDGIDPDHCQNVEIRNCDIACGDDAIVVKTTRQTNDFGPCTNIYVHDCVLQTQDSGLKIGTETTSDIRDIRFEKCRIITGSRGLTIQLRDEGNISNVVFRDINFTARYYSDPWWGRGEAISFTALPRTNTTTLGTLQKILVQNVTGLAENSVRVNGTSTNRVRDVIFDNVALTLGRWTKYPGGLFDNRPTRVLDPIEPHGTSGFDLRYADNVTLNNCSVHWMKNLPEYFTFALEVENVAGLRLTGFKGTAAHPDRDPAIFVH